jgi:hypothetical protein
MNNLTFKNIFQKVDDYLDGYPFHKKLCLLQLVLENNGKLSENNKLLFSELSNEQISYIENLIVDKN